MQCLSAAHAFDHIVLRITPGLSSCKDLATVVDISPDNYSRLRLRLNIRGIRRMFSNIQISLELHANYLRLTFAG